MASGSPPSSAAGSKCRRWARCGSAPDVEIGANTTIDRGAVEDTVIEEGVKLDNLIMIAHNVRVGAHTAIAALTGISGSTTIGKRCQIAGEVAIGGHLTICDDVVFLGTTMVSHSITEPGVYSSGIPLEKPQSGAAWSRASSASTGSKPASRNSKATPGATHQEEDDD